MERRRLVRELPKNQEDENESSFQNLWKTAEKILKGPKSTKKSIVLGLFLMPASLPIIGAGRLLNDSLTTAVGSLILVGGILLFFGGITGEIAV